jgi:carboxypeptidase Taq
MEKRKIQDLINQIRPKAILQSVSYVLDWDQETYMPKKGVHFRSEQQALIAELLHKEATSEKLKQILGKYIDLSSGKILEEGLSIEEKAILREVRRDYLQESRLPTDFVKKFKKVTTIALHAWKEAKEKRDFLLFAPHLKEIVALSIEKAKYLGTKTHPYECLLDIYEPNISIKILDDLFNPLKEKLINLVKKVSKPIPANCKFLSEHFEHNQQMAFARRLVKDMGIDSETCRLDLTEHPFCTAFGPHDVRITTKVHPNSIMDSLFAVIHEAGHALYQLQLPENEFGNPLGEPTSMGIHESQSRLWEVYIGQSMAFWDFYGPEFTKSFSVELEGKTSKDFYDAVNQVKPSLIRIFADEVTYSLHIIIRYEIEKGLIEGSINVDDLPNIWKEKMEKYLGITPKDDSEGVLQDIHWSMGYFGYFPSYSLGSIYAAAIWQKIGEDFPDRDQKIRDGDLLFIRDWLKTNIHSKGRFYPPVELIEKATGKPFSINPYINYLESKYPIQ